MALSAAVGQSALLDGREACTQAIRVALAGLGDKPISLAFLFVSHEYDTQDVLNAALAQLGSVPLLGFSTSGELAAEGGGHRSVTAALLAGDEVRALADWLPGFAENSRGAAAKAIANLRLEEMDGGALLVVADGVDGDGEDLCRSLPLSDYTVAGCLAGGDLRSGRTFQIGGAQAGTGGLAVAALSGRVKVGVGVGHGWQAVGASFRITTSRGPWVRAMDGRPASESFAGLFGHRARDWAFPPLNTLVRLYPLGIEHENHPGQFQVRSPVRIEADGSLRMNTAVPDGVVGHLLVGSAENCLNAARQAARQALNALEGAEPALALVLVDVSWQMLLKGQQGNEVDAVREVLGPDVPIAGGYTFGQLARVNGSRQAELLNQHIEVIVFGRVESHKVVA